MTPATREWVAKAEADFATASRELSVREAPNFDAVCFHAQQCAEKYLKARLVEANHLFPRTHDLTALLELLLPLEPVLVDLRRPLEALTDLAVEIRYPGVSADFDDARKSVEAAGTVRRVARRSLGCPVETNDAGST